MSSELARRIADAIAIQAHGLRHRDIAVGCADVYASIIDAELAGVREAVGVVTGAWPYGGKKCQCDHCKLHRAAAQLSMPRIIPATQPRPDGEE